MKRNTALLLFICLLFHLNAQAQTGNINGQVIDNTTKESIESASIRILNAKDNTYLTGTVTNAEGKFRINVKPAKYIIQISFLGYKTQSIDVDARQNGSIGTIYLSDDGVLLNEAVVTAKAVEIQVKGDTVEYNANSYKVQESAVVEDLLKKMPGVEVDANGKITVNGKEVKKFLVDGKEFFSDDPKVASKNLPAAMVNKLQVLDRKSDMAQMTGFDDGNEETVINLTIKPGMKEGLYGNAFAGYGTEDRHEANGMVNYMRNNTQITAITGTNNTNNAGFSDFASDMFSGNRPRGVNFGGNNGITKSTNGGLNFATEYSTKLKLGGNLRYGFSDNDVASTSTRTYTGQDRTMYSWSKANNVSNNFGTDFRLEWSPDSLTKIIFRPSIQYNKNDNNSLSHNEGIDRKFGDILTDNSYFSNGNGTNLNGNLDISRQLNRKGRVISLSLSSGLRDAKSDGNIYSKNTYYYNEPTITDSIAVRDQRFYQDDKSDNWRAFLSYVEPLGRNNFLQLTYNIRKNSSETDRRTYSKEDITSDFYNVVDSAYTRNIKNDFVNQNVSLNFKSVRAKFNYTLGIGLEPSSSRTEIWKLNVLQNDLPRRNFLSVVPTAQFNYLWNKRHNLRIDYVGTTNQATALQLSNVSIPSDDGITTTIGNPDLKPSFQNSLRIRYQKFNPETSSAIMVFSRVTYTLNDIVTTSNWQGVSSNTITYKNIDGNRSANIRFIYNTPLRNKKFSVNSMTFMGYNRSNTYINGGQNTADIYTPQENLGLQFRSDKFDFNIRGNISYNGVRNSISSDRNQNAFDYGGFGSLTFYMPKGFTVDSDMQYSTNSGYKTGFDLNMWLWNASISKQVFKNKAGLIRIKMNDILQQRANISRQTGAEYLEDVSTNVLPSYVMVNFVYKFQVFKGGVKRADMENNMQPEGPGRGHGGGRGFGGGRPPL